MCLCVSQFPLFHQNTTLDQGPLSWPQLNHPSEALISKYGHILRCWGLRLQLKNLFLEGEVHSSAHMSERREGEEESREALYEYGGVGEEGEQRCQRRGM